MSAPVQLDDESTGECPCGCGESAYPFAIPGIDDGYVDAAPGCAESMIADAIEAMGTPNGPIPFAGEEG